MEGTLLHCIVGAHEGYWGHFTVLGKSYPTHNSQIRVAYRNLYPPTGIIKFE